jgi:predicted dehydrogenase
MKKALNIAILGAGSIVPDFLEAAAKCEELHIYAIWGRESSLERMKGFQEQYEIEQIYLDYDALLADECVDAVYVALPNHLHFAYAKKALEHGKHALVEKPFAASYEQAKELVSCARAHNVMAFEAISTLYLPNYAKTAQMLPRLGEVKIVQMNFSQYSRRYDQFKLGNILPVFDPKQSGGALMDLNVYNIHYVLGLFGKPERVHYAANIQKGIDTSGILTLEYPHFQCACVGAKDCKAPVSINIQGDQGYIHSDDTPNMYNSFYYSENGGDPEVITLNEGMPRLYYELKAFADMVLEQNRERFEQCAQHTLEVQEVLDEARRQVGIEV